MGKLRLKTINMKGQTLVEVLVALGVSMIVLTAITTAVLTSLNNAQYSRLQNQAAQYAQQGIEIMRSYRDAKSLAELGGTLASPEKRCLVDTCNPIIGNNFTGCFVVADPTTCTKIDGIFSRSVETIKDASACVDGGTGSTQVTSVVRWNDGKCDGDELCHSVDVKTCMQDALREGL